MIAQHMNSPRRSPHVRRGVLMLAVLVVLAVAALVAGGLLAASEAEHAGLASMRDRTQQRAIGQHGNQRVTQQVGRITVAPHRNVRRDVVHRRAWWRNLAHDGT